MAGRTADVELLLARHAMVELENDRILFAAVGALSTIPSLFDQRSKISIALISPRLLDV